MKGPPKIRTIDSELWLHKIKQQHKNLESNVPDINIHIQDTGNPRLD